MSLASTTSLAGKTPADYNYNVEITRNVTKMAHWAGVSVEGELGVLGSLESGHRPSGPSW
jgi:fructose/tagatose bisphosphate aldolase